MAFRVEEQKECARAEIKEESLSSHDKLQEIVAMNHVSEEFREKKRISQIDLLETMESHQPNSVII